MAKMSDHDKMMRDLGRQVTKDLDGARVELQSGELERQRIQAGLESVAAAARKAARTESQINAAINSATEQHVKDLQEVVLGEEQAKGNHEARVAAYTAAFKKHGVLFDPPVSEFDSIDSAVAAVAAEMEAKRSEAKPPEIPHATSGKKVAELGRVKIHVSTGQTWKLKTSIARFPGYRGPLHRFLKAQFAAGTPRPNARDFLDYLIENQQPGLKVLLPDRLEYSTGKGWKEATLKSISASISALIQD